MHFRLEICKKIYWNQCQKPLDFCLPLRNHFRLNFGTKMWSKFLENNIKTGLRTWSLTEIAENTAKMSPEASARLQKTSQDAAEGFHEAPNLAHRKVSRRLFSIAMQNYNSPFAVCPSQAPQLSLRSFEKLFSTPTFSTYSSKFGVHRGTFLSEMQLPTFRSSQCTLKCWKFIAEGSQL